MVLADSNLTGTAGLLHLSHFSVLSLVPFAALIPSHLLTISNQHLGFFSGCRQFHFSTKTISQPAVRTEPTLLLFSSFLENSTGGRMNSHQTQTILTCIRITDDKKIDLVLQSPSFSFFRSSRYTGYFFHGILCTGNSNSACLTATSNQVIKNL